MVVTKINEQKDIDNLMKELNDFHDYVLLHIDYTSGASFSINGIYPIAKDREVKVKLGAFINGSEKIVELVFKKLVCMNMVPIDERYDSIIIKASLHLKGKNIVFSDCADYEDEQSLLIESEELEVHC